MELGMCVGVMGGRVGVVCSWKKGRKRRKKGTLFGREECSMHSVFETDGDEYYLANFTYLVPRYHSSFNELLDTPTDFSNFIMNLLGVNTLTPELLAGPTYELMRGSCNSLTEIEYHLEEVYKATTDQLDWVNPEDTNDDVNVELKDVELDDEDKGGVEMADVAQVNDEHIQEQIAIVHEEINPEATRAHV
nr:hypothetical protein [Tanacetum cinerariifolium]